MCAPGGRHSWDWVNSSKCLPPQMRVSQQWYQGTADAVYQNIYSIGSERSKFVFILSGDHIYKMNYAKMLQTTRRFWRGRHCCDS